MTEDVVVHVKYGHSTLDTRLRPEGDRLIGEGRRCDFDRDGNLEKDHGWQPSGITMGWTVGRGNRGMSHPLTLAVMWIAGALFGVCITMMVLL